MKSKKLILISSILYWWWKKQRRVMKRKRRFWMRPIFQQRERLGAGKNLIMEMRLFDANKFKNFFRMGSQGFEELLSIIGPSIRKVDVRRQPITPATRLAITLRYLASGDSMTSLSYLFRTGLSTISEIIAETTEIIWQLLKSNYVQSPIEDTWRSIADGFKRSWQFPNCVGAIDGKHITIQATPHSGSTYYNYKGEFSIVILAVADDKYTFSLVDIGAQGRQSNGGIFRNSAIGQLLLNESLNIPTRTQISKDRPSLPFVMVDDEAFPLSAHLLRPYAASGGLDLDKNIFNYRLSRARRIVENTFGILSARWRIFGRPIIAKVENIDNIVKATVCLHNFIMKKYKNETYITPRLLDKEINGACIPGTWRNVPSCLQSIGRVGANTYNRNAKQIRDEFKNYFNEEGAVSWQWDRI